ncbi:MAG: hypothetical protein KKH94_13100 [Candidatus Omnitrophica bacterium]|nr:hypothetical protein [Candidatus Omnitrophota bacterium]
MRIYVVAIIAIQMFWVLLAWVLYIRHKAYRMGGIIIVVSLIANMLCIVIVGIQRQRMEAMSHDINIIQKRVIDLSPVAGEKVLEIAQSIDDIQAAIETVEAVKGSTRLRYEGQIQQQQKSSQRE